MVKITEQLHQRARVCGSTTSRGPPDSGTLQRYINELSVTGLTSNPSIFNQAIKNVNFYDAAIAEKVKEGMAGEALFFELAIEDLTRAAELFGPIRTRWTNGLDGFVSLEVSPRLAYDTQSTLAAASNCTPRRSARTSSSRFRHRAACPRSRKRSSPACRST